MRDFTLYSNVKLLSLNHAFSTLRNGMRVRSKEYAEFSKYIKDIMKIRKKEFDAFENEYDSNKHSIHASLIFATPKLFTQKGAISQKSGDLDNLTKCLIDNVLINKINDSQILKINLEKKYSENYYFILKLEIVDR